MSLFRDLRLLEEATAIPALREVVREALIRVMFVRDERALPRELVAVLRGRAEVVVRPKDELEVRQAVRVANGEESTVSLGRPADEFHYYRRRLGVAKDTPWGVSVRPTMLQTYDWIVPPQGGIELDLGALDAVELDGVTPVAKVGPGARWKALYDRATKAGMLPAVFPSVPLDVAVGDGVVGDARFRSYHDTFASFVYDVTGVAGNGLKVHCGFERVPGHATGYNLRDLAVQIGAEFLVPTALHVRLAPRPPVVRNLVYAYDDPAKLGAALDRVARTGRPYLWANLYDERAWALVHGGAAPGPIALEVGVGGNEVLAAARAKALDAAAAGFTAKGEAAVPWDADADAYRARSEKIGKLLFVGEIVTAAGSAGTAIDRVRALGQTKGARAGFFGTAMDTGQAYVAPYFEAAKEPLRTYDLSRGVADLVRGIGDAAFDARLAYLWSEDPHVRRRTEILLRLEEGLDAANAIEPPATLAAEPIELFPGGTA